jgi:hypothetical protein
MVRWNEAFQRKHEAHLDLLGEWLPHGNGLPTDESISEMDAAQEEFCAAQAEVDRITEEIRAGKRYGALGQAVARPVSGGARCLLLARRRCLISSAGRPLSRVEDREEPRARRG